MALTNWIMLKVQALDPATHWSELSLVVMDDAGMADINTRFLEKAHPTDVISFRYDPDPGPKDTTTGEVLVNAHRAWEEGGQRDGADAELALYIAHGCHHLTGAEDHTPELKTEMLRIENAWVTEAMNELDCGELLTNARTT